MQAVKEICREGELKPEEVAQPDAAESADDEKKAIGKVCATKSRWGALFPCLILRCFTPLRTAPHRSGLCATARAPATSAASWPVSLMWASRASATRRRRRCAGLIYPLRDLPRQSPPPRHQAGKDIAKKGLKFDRVYVSHLRRTSQTAEGALKNSGNGHMCKKMIVDSRIAERSFGIFAGDEAWRDG